MQWPVEDIPDHDRIFYRVHKQNIRDGVVKPKQFKEWGEGVEKGMSTNWERYASALITKTQAATPENYGIVSFVVGELRMQSLTVRHAPLEENQSHTNVNGLPDDIKDVEVRVKLLDLYTWEISLENI